MPQDAHDEQRGDAQPLPPVRERRQYAVRRGRERDAAPGVSLGIEEQLDMHGPVGGRAFQIGGGEVVEVLFGAQHVHAPVVDVQEVLQLGEAIGGPDLLHRAERDVDPVPAGQAHHQFRLERALQMKVQLGLGQRPDKRPHVHSGLHANRPARPPQANTSLRRDGKRRIVPSPWTCRKKPRSPISPA